MNLSQLSLLLALLCFLITFAATSNNPTHFTGDVSINCGSKGTSAARNGREWLGDAQPKLSSLLQLNGLSAASRVIHKLTSADPVPHNTARLSRSQFSYAFQVNPGQKIIRLHFNPTQYKVFKGSKDLFTVEAGSFTLLSNFSASLTAHALSVNTFAKEFCLNIQENQQLIIVFSPESSQSLDAYAFINGIEIISVPAGLSYFYSGDMGLHVVGQKSLVYVDHRTALEIIHRLYIRKDFVSSADDSSNMFGMWATLPKREVNNINSITWKISVDLGFRYLVRLHFSKIGFKMAKTGGVSFKVLINEMVANTDIVVKERDDSSVPWYGDYLVMMNGRKQEGKRNLLICLQSDEEFMDGHGPLKGFEILKLSNPDSSLASPNPVPPPKDSPSQTIQPLLFIHGHRNAIATIAITIVSLLNITVHALRENWEASSNEEENKPSARAERLCRCFSLAEIKLATRNFNDGLLIGRGGFGKVYKGLIDKGQRTVAVKRLKSHSRQGAHEFLTEIETLSELRHINLVPLIGYCSENREMILVYEYMASGTLADQLYKLPSVSSNHFSLTWKQRLNICIGAARGLDYLHTGHGVIHRDVKASNILLDENFVAKVSDFGLAKPEDRSKLQSHVSTKVKGTIGYLDPYYFTTHKLTRKSDTYAFGVVLFEVLCGRPAVGSGVAEDERILTKWVRDRISNGEVYQIVASRLRDEISLNSLKTFVGVAERCLHDEPKNRPTMSQVVLQLEFALEQQDSSQNTVFNEITSISDKIHPSNDGFNLSDRVRKTMASTDMQNFTLPLDEQTDKKVINAEIISGREHETQSLRNKPSRIWPWDAFWKRVKPSKKYELLSSVEEIFEADINLTKFDWHKIAAATNHFSSLNIVGRGESSSVYKAVLHTGQVVAVKRLLPKKFKNEIVLLPNLQHPNIIKLHGYCVYRQEKLLIYEFMENGSLDTFIGLDTLRAPSQCLQWPLRFKIIMGIARGVVYLHQDSGLRVVHRNLKSRNILLDIEMNPKISDIATSLEHQSEYVPTMIGTYGYMPPEWFIQGAFSVKSDVYSYGIIALELVSGRRRISTPSSESMMSLHEYAWKLWREGKALDLVDDLFAGEFPADEALRCIQIGLLCTQWNPEQRPEMPSVLKMLEGDEPPPGPRNPGPRNPGPPALIEDSHSNATFEFDDTLER